MQKLTINTKKEKEIFDLTELINDLIVKSAYDKGVCHLFVTHTTCALTTADLDPGTEEDMINAFEKMIPSLEYKHMHDPEHVPDHIMSAIIGPSLTIPVQNASMVLGSWQRVVLVELSGPKERHLAMTFMSDKRKTI